MQAEIKTNQITLTAEQLVNIVGHAATQEQLDNVRRELDTKLDKIEEKLDAKIYTVRTELNANIAEVKIELKHDIASSESRINSRIDGLQTQFDKLDKRIWALAALIIALAFKAEILAWLG